MLGCCLQDFQPDSPWGTLLQTALELPKAVGISHHHLGPWDANSNKWASSGCQRRPRPAMERKTSRVAEPSWLLLVVPPLLSTRWADGRASERGWTRDGPRRGGDGERGCTTPFVRLLSQVSGPESPSLATGALRGPSPSCPGGTTTANGSQSGFWPLGILPPPLSNLS